jgi:predicted ATPase/DNA-binding winged helix-turn-helix (wHTH) protein
MVRPAAQTKDVISFGPFSLLAGERLLTKQGVPVELSARALDILIALVSRPNEAISKRELLAQVWPDVIVEETGLRFHIANLRKALGDGKDGARYITTLPGRGYCFVAPISRSSTRDNEPASVTADFPHANLPSRLVRMIGRDDDVLRLSTQLTATRFVTIVGSGGVGKTTVAVAVGHHLVEPFAGAALFVDLSMLKDPNLVATAVASMLGLSVHSDDATPSLLAYLRDRRIILILDTCEHLIEAVAALASQVFMAASQAHILATSREALQVEGEHVYRLNSLECPPDVPELTAAITQTFPAAQLFLERAAAVGVRLDLNDTDAAIVGSICRKLDGVALAIELAARRVEAYGLQQIATLLDQRLTLLWPGPRTAPPRQKTLHAALDWSYGLLSELERVALRRLAVFVGHFTLDAALAVVTSATLDRAQALDAIDSLVAKSMVAARPAGAMMHYRLLDTTRAYALESSVDDAELADLAMRHATYYRQWLAQTGIEWPRLSSGLERAPHFAALNNVRAALEWCFSANGNTQLGIGLAVAAAPVFLAMSLLPECQRWSERALLALDAACHGGREEMYLQTALGLSLQFAQSDSEGAQAAFNRSLAIAEDLADARTQLQVLGILSLLHGRIGDFKGALHYGRRCSDVSKTLASPAALALGHSIFGASLRYSGDLGGARMELEAALRHWPGSQRTSTTYLGFNGHVLTGGYLSRILWLQGHPAQAVQCAHQIVTDATSMDHPVTLSIAFICAIIVFLSTGEFQSAQEHIDRFITHAESYPLGPYLAVAHGFKGQLAICRGNAEDGLKVLQSCLEDLHAARYELRTTTFHISLVQGLEAIGRFPEAMALIDETILQVQSNGDTSYMPELLRLKAGLFLSKPQPSGDDAKMYLMRSLELSRRQGARAWELRTVVDLAKLLVAQGRPENARELLQPVFKQFSEGLNTADLKAAERLLADLNG